MNETRQLVDSIVEGIQDKKGHRVRVVDLTKIDDTICRFLVICEGNSPTQVAAIADSVKDMTLKRVAQKPLAVDGLRNAVWVALDYADVVAHVFLPDARAFYDIDHLWEDAYVIEVEDC